MGYIFYRVIARSVRIPQWQTIALYLFAANAPDMDFIPGFFVGNPELYHHWISHSIGFAVIFASLSGLFLLLLRGDTFIRGFAIFFSLYFSHIVLDYLSIDSGFPYGEPIFWPLSNKYYIASFAFLPDIQRTSGGSEFILSLISQHNLWAVSVEFILLSPLLLMVLALKRRYRGSTENA